MTTTRYHADHLLMTTGEPEIVSDGVVDVTDGTIAWSGPASAAPDSPADTERVSGLLMPGFVNTHAHSPMVLLRGAGEGLPVDRWLAEVMWPREGRLSEDDVAWGMALGAAELLAAGITTSHEAYFFGAALAQAADAAGLRAVVTPPILTGDALARLGDWQEQLDGIAELADAYAGHERIEVGLGPHAAYSLAEEPLTAVATMAAERGLHVHIHVAEGEHEGDDIARRYGLTVPAYLDRIGMLESHVVAAHCVWVTDDDIALLAARDVGVAHCPLSNGKHASGIAPVTAMRAAGIPVGVATDGPSSHDRLDPFEEMRMAIRLARLRARDAGAMVPSDALLMATREAAAVLGRNDLGTLAPGAQADMIRLDVDPLTPIIEAEDLITQLVYAGSPALVRDVWVGGRRVVADGTPTTVDLATARAEVTARARRLATG